MINLRNYAPDRRPDGSILETLLLQKERTARGR
jgi:hypothetical protein